MKSQTSRSRIGNHAVSRQDKADLIEALRRRQADIEAGLRDAEIARREHWRVDAERRKRLALARIAALGRAPAHPASAFSVSVLCLLDRYVRPEDQATDE
jgi:hypothetical protein